MGDATRAKRLVVIGAGGHGKMVIEAARAAWPEIVVCDDDPALAGTSVLDVTVAGGRAWLDAQPAESIAAIVAVGANATRARLLDRLAASNIEIVTVVHRRAIVSPSALVGEGTFLAPGAIIGSEARIGRGAIVNTGASVDHDSVIGPCAHVGPGAHLCGEVAVGARTLIGVGASVAPGIKIGSDCRIGAGAAVIRDISDNATAVGVPALPI